MMENTSGKRSSLVCLQEQVCLNQQQICKWEQKSAEADQERPAAG